MDIKDLRPKVFPVDPQSSDARKQWSHWFRSFGCYVQKYENISDEDNLSLLVNHVDALVYEIISEANTYDNAFVNYKTFTLSLQTLSSPGTYCDCANNKLVKLLTNIFKNVTT